MVNNLVFRKSIEIELLELVKNAPKGVSTHYLKHFDQEDVEDTVNTLHLDHPAIRDTFKGYATYTPIEIEK